MKRDERLENEIAHGRYIAKSGESIWNWSSPAGKIRWERRSKTFVDFLGNSGKRVLEIGCGTGLFTQEICGTNNEIVAIDISNDLIDLAKKRINKKNVAFVVDNAYSTKFESNSFDFIVGSSSLHHLELDPALKEMYRLLRPAGKFMFTEPNMLNPQIAVQKNIALIKRLAGDSPDETAFLGWRLKKKLEEMHFHDVAVVPFDFVHPAIPEFMLKAAVPVLNFLERVPVVSSFAGSLIITGEK